MEQNTAVPYASPASAAGAPFVSQPQRYDGILLAGFGGPEGQEDVIPFLRNVTRGRGIPEERLEEVAHHYRRFGGISPINAQNRALKKALERELAARGIDLPVYWGNRNWAPYLTDAVREADAAGDHRLLALATSAYSSFSSCRQYREDFARALEETGLAETMTIDKIRQFFDHPGFVDSFVPSVLSALQRFRDDGTDVEHMRVLFTTHSIPLADAQRSGPRDADFGPGGAYEAQHRAVAAAVMRRVGDQDAMLKDVSWELVYQSRSGPAAQPWLEPDVCDRIAELPGESVEAIAISPIGFVSDHMEVLWDLDTEALEAASEAGLRAVRTETPGTAHTQVAGIVDLIEERMSAVDPADRPSATALGPWFDVCRPGCCENVRAGFKRAAAGVAP
ncbi:MULTISPECIES: ferrochelatase [unclassified Pseudoclavibacter]|uniref:ferrochelatase n=1 Tax=unclassified Pseudoclavibacter TaxID=2615177 RepID=UPI00130193B6|nr:MULTISPECIES: ferrochelatase [unclassified Pseudoclavibacter]KAB1657653.1 ferrochelatase [Pseudoclavibacter sp. CFCC 11306]KAB1660471.1 ferrochelatase [Pseudoclavibacter sp. CFCC 13796]